MPKLKITKTLAFDQEVAQAIENMARKERRSFTKQVELMLESALSKQSRKREKTPA